MNCPKCGETMRNYERSGVTVDQCTGCRGIYLDRGELERLVDAEAGYYATGPDRATFDSRSGHGREGHGDEGHGASGRKRRGFLGDLFD